MKSIILEYRYKIKKIIKNFTGEENEDIEQEVYIKTYQNLGKYEERNKFSAWICTIASNVCRDYLKSSNFKKYANAIEDKEELLNNIQASDNPEKNYTSKERQKIILNAVKSLPKKMKEAIILYEFEDYSYEQISKKTNTPIGTVKSRINSARKILQEKLAYLLGDD